MCAFQQQNRLQMGKLWPKLASGNSCKTMIVTWADSPRHPSFHSLSISTFYSPIMQPIQKMTGANKDSKWPCIHWTWWPEVESMIIFRRYAQNHGLWTPNEAFFHWNPKLLGLGRQIGQINFGHLGYFWLYQHPFWYSESFDHVFHYSTIISSKN